MCEIKAVMIIAYHLAYANFTERTELSHDPVPSLHYRIGIALINFVFNGNGRSGQYVMLGKWGFRPSVISSSSKDFYVKIVNLFQTLKKNLLSEVCNSPKCISDVWLTVYRDSVWIRKTNYISLLYSLFLF